MFCMKCGTELPDNAQFCYKCGAKTAGANNDGGDNKKKHTYESSSHNRKTSTYNNNGSSSRSTYDAPKALSREEQIQKDFLSKLLRCFSLTDLIDWDDLGIHYHSLYLTGADGFDGRVSGALQSYASGLGLKKEEVIVLQDDTFSNNGKEGFLITEKGIVTSETNGLIPYRYVKQMKYYDSHFHVIMIDDTDLKIPGACADAKGSKFASMINSVLCNKDVVEGFEYLRNIEVNGGTPSYNFSNLRKSGSSSSSDSGCFITTAVCGSLNKPDDCDELMSMRWLRDKLKVEDANMAALIEEYYRVAPLVVKKIDSSVDASMVYRRLWDNTISQIYDDIKQRDYQDAKLRYISMLEDLCIRYDEPLAYGIRERIDKVKRESVLN